MKRKIKSFLLVYIILSVSILFTSCTFVTVVPLDKIKNTTNATFEDADFDPTQYVQEKWTDVDKYAKENAKPLADVVAAFVDDPNDCGTKYGYRHTEKDAWNFIVTGNAKVLNVNKKSANGLLELDMRPYDGNADCYLQIGTVVTGSALRDSMGFINFQDFKNQITFGDVAKALNKYSVDNVSSKLSLDSLQGKTVTIFGAFSIDSLSQDNMIKIVPIEISVS